VISWFSVLASLVIAFQLPAAPAPEAAPRTEAGLAVEALDRRGEPLRDPKPEDFTVTEDGASLRVLGLETGKPWRVVVYVDRILSSMRSVRGAAGLLATQVRELTALGTVEILIAEPEPRTVLPPTRDPIAVDEALSRLMLTGEGRDDLRMLRQRFLEEVGAPAERPEDLADRLGEAVAAETRLAGRQHDFLLEWLAESRGADGPRALFLVSDGFDLDPRTPYLAKIPDEALRSALRAELPDPGLAGRNRELAQTAAALGWSVLPMPVGNERLPELGRFRPRSTEEVPIGVAVTPGRKKEQPPPGSTLPELVAPQAPLFTLAEETGGEVLTTPSAAASAIARLSSRVWLRYEEPELAREELRPIEVRSASADRTTAVKWRGPAVPETIVARRALRLLSMEEDEEGDGAIETALRQATDPAGALSWTLELRPEAPALRRLTLAIPSGTGDAISHRLLFPTDLGKDGLWRVPVALSSEVDRIAIVVDDPVGGAWESRLLPVVTRDAEEPDDEPISEVAEAPVRPEPGGRGLRIVSPAGGRAIGPVDVEVALDVPRDRRLERLEIFWNDELAATLYGPPYRHRVNIPRNQPVGYLRASARLDDGTLAEDAVLLNSTAVGERLDVRLIELYVVVTDRDGRPVHGLGKNDFRLLQDGREQAIAGFDDAGASPLSLGLAFDSSASMFLKLPHVQDAARTLLTGSLSTRDRALLVDFDSEPRLVTGMTGSLDTVSAGLGTLRADGNSDLFEAIIFSLQKLQAVSGRKALVVYSDGIGEGEKTSYRACMREARRSNIPVYLIVTNQRAARATESGTQEPLDAYAERLHDLATATGGRAFFVMPSQDLKDVYANILKELRSQYLLTYYPPTTAPEVWRKVRVELKKRGYQARTVSGYYAR
jgi:Ca-activated chloride channel family protein